MGVQFKAIPVRDANGDQLIVYEVWKKSLFGLVGERSWQLCTGEEVERLGNSFVVIHTGESLAPISDG